MAAVRPTYTIDNLPEGFVYDQTQRQIFSPFTRTYSILNPDNSVNSPPFTHHSVDEFVTMQLVIRDGREKVRRGEVRDRVSEPFRSRYVTIKCLDCTIDREKLVILSIFLATLLIVCTGAPIMYYTWPNGVFG